MREKSCGMRRILPIVMAVMIATLAALLFGCDEPTVPQITAEEKLQMLVEEFESRPSCAVEGTIYKDGATTGTMKGAVDDESKRLRLTLDGTEYLYFNRYLVKREESGYIVDKAGTSYAEVLTNLPFSMFAFTNDPKRMESVSIAEDLITINFYNTGVKDSFSSKLSVSGGVFAIHFKGNRVTRTVLTTKLTENGVTSTYSAHYTYGGEEKAFEDIPEIEATNTVNYALYVVNAIDANYEGLSMWIAGRDYDTHNPITALTESPENIADATVITTWEDGTRVLRVNFSTPVDVQMITYMTSFEITYSPDYHLVGNFKINNIQVTLA